MQKKETTKGQNWIWLCPPAGQREETKQLAGCLSAWLFSYKKKKTSKYCDRENFQTFWGSLSLNNQVPQIGLYVCVYVIVFSLDQKLKIV